MYDARIGRFLSIDPLAGKYPWNSPYAFAENRVLDGVELEGLEYKRLDEIPGEIAGAFSWAGEQLWGAVEGAYELITSPVQTSGQIVDGYIQAAEDVGTIYGTFGQILYGQATGESANIDEDGFYDAINRQGQNIAQEGVFGIVGGVLASSPSVPYSPLRERGSLTNIRGLAGAGTRNLDEFTPGQGFSGVYDVRSGDFMMYPSANPGQPLHYADGTLIPPDQRVSNVGGHQVVDDHLSASIGQAELGGRVGFALFKEGDSWKVRFNSGMVNTPHHGSRTAPERFHQPIINSLNSSFGIEASSGM